MSKAGASLIFSIFLIIIYNCCFNFSAAISSNDNSSFVQNDMLRERLRLKGLKADNVTINQTTKGFEDYYTRRMREQFNQSVETISKDDESSFLLYDIHPEPIPLLLKGLKAHNFTINQTTGQHDYYISRMYVNKDEVTEIWNFMKIFPNNPLLSQAHRLALAVELTFDFPFYGQSVRKITITTGGFIYTGDYVHSYLAATQYIAPLMANFDTSLPEESFVRFNDNGTAFSVLWENVLLHDKQYVGKFTFVTTLHKSGEIVFAYYKLPFLVNAMPDDEHHVKVGLSDAYLANSEIYFPRSKRIYEYHHFYFGQSKITNSTLIRLTPLPTCHSYTDCAACISNPNTSLKCAWCPKLNRCSTGLDRGTQAWVTKGCDWSQINDISNCPALGGKDNNASSMISNKKQENTGELKAKGTMISTTDAPTADNNNKRNQNEGGHPAAFASLNEV